MRLQYEELLPMLAPAHERQEILRAAGAPAGRLAAALAGAAGPEEFARRLNEFKDREIYLFDLDHILTPAIPELPHA